MAVCVQATQLEMHGLKIILASEMSDFRILTRSLFTLGILPTWRCGFVVSSVMSLYLTYTGVES